MSDSLREALKPLLAGLQGSLPICPSWMYEAVRHCQRNMDFEAHDGFHEPDRHSGVEIAKVVNLLPDILNALRASTDATPHYHQSPLMTENGAGRASTDAAPVAGESGDLAEVKSELEWLVSLAKDSVETAHAVKEIDASAAKVIAALSHPPATDTAQAEPGLSAAEAWQDLVDKDDRTSPEEYPDMALITREELADYMQAAHAQAEPVGRDWFPILGSQGQRIDYQLVADHGQQAQSNHYQTVKRLKERGGLSWCELYAVLHNRKYEKIDVNDAMIACRALEARYLAALSTPPARTDDELEALYDRIHREELAKGGRMGEIRLRVVRRFNIAAALPKEPKQ